MWPLDFCHSVNSFSLRVVYSMKVSLGFRVAWNRTVEYDEERQCTAYCDARKSTAQRCKTRYGEKCERAKGLFLVLNVPLRGSAAEG